MNASPKSRLKPWLWFSLICLIAPVTLVTLEHNYSHATPCMSFLLLFLFPASIGAVGGYHKKIAVAIAGGPVLYLAIVAGMFGDAHYQLLFASPTGVPDYGVPIIGGSALVLFPVVSIFSYTILNVFSTKPLTRPGHCRECGRDLGFRVDVPCPACGEPVLCLGCGYNLTGNVSGICPECETAVEVPPVPPLAEARAGGVRVDEAPPAADAAREDRR